MNIFIIFFVVMVSQGGVCVKLCSLLCVHFISIGLLKIQMAPPKQHCLQNCPPFPQHPPRLSLGTLTENVEIVARLLILCTQHRLPHPKRHYPTKVSCYSVNLSSILGAARLLLKPQTISLLLLLFYSQIKDDI